MRSNSRSIKRIFFLHCSGAAIVFAGCGGGSGSMTQPPIAVFLPISTVVVHANGMPVVVPIQISSTSETALVMLSGLPTGVQVKYAASDTNPSGQLSFTANAATQAGTTMPTVSVESAGQAASANFTLTVKVP